MILVWLIYSDIEAKKECCCVLFIDSFSLCMAMCIFPANYLVVLNIQQMGCCHFHMLIALEHKHTYCESGKWNFHEFINAQMCVNLIEMWRKSQIDVNGDKRVWAKIYFWSSYERILVATRNFPAKKQNVRKEETRKKKRLIRMTRVGVTQIKCKWILNEWRFLE